MIVHFDPRAQVAFRSLDVTTQADVLRTIASLAPATEDNWRALSRAQLLHVMSGEVLFSIQAGTNLRLLAKELAGSLIVQDIFSRERLERISGKILHEAID